MPPVAAPVAAPAPARERIIRSLARPKQREPGDELHQQGQRNKDAKKENDVNSPGVHFEPKQTRGGRPAQEEPAADDQSTDPAEPGPHAVNTFMGSSGRRVRQPMPQVVDALWEADDDRAVHCVILRANGPAFCAGYDLAPARRERDDEINRRTGRGIDEDVWNLERIQRQMRTLWEMHKPTIAQISGHCLAGGTDLALYCDILIAADDANIGFPPLRNMGSPPNHLWLYNCGPQWTKRLLLTGDTISGKDAEKIGFVMKSVPPELLEAEVEGLADRLAHVDTALLAANKRIVNLGLELMGAGTLQRLASENDARAHTAPAARQMFKDLGEKGIKTAIAERDAPFGDGRARVDGPETRDEDGRLI